MSQTIDTEQLARHVASLEDDSLKTLEVEETLALLGAASGRRATLQEDLALGVANLDDGPPRSDRLALDEIARLMSGEEWDADTSDRIAEIVRSTGRKVQDAGEQENEDAGEE